MPRSRVVPSEMLVGFAAGSLLVYGTGRLRHRLRAWRDDVRAATAQAIATEQARQRAETAEALLVTRGYAIVARDAPAAYAVTVEGEPLVVHLTADFLVEREGSRFVAELKVGASAQLATASTRWQFLEHQHAFGVRSVLLVDPDAGTLQTIRFPLSKTTITAVPPPLPHVRAASLRASRAARAVARNQQRKRVVRYACVAAVVGLLVWVLRAPGSSDPAVLRPASAEHE